MTDFPQEYLIFFAIALVAVLALLWWIMLASRRTRIQRDDSANDGPTKRNQALIDAPAASAGPVSAAANLDRVAAATANVDAEAGASVPAAEAPAAPETAPAPEPAPETASGGDDLRRIKGLGPKLVTMLAEQGVTTFAQIAAWDDADIDRIDAQLGRFQGRIRRDDWVAQAKLLAADDLAGYEQKFGNLK